MKTATRPPLPRVIAPGNSDDDVTGHTTSRVVGWYDPDAAAFDDRSDRSPSDPWFTTVPPAELESEALGDWG